MRDPVRVDRGRGSQAVTLPLPIDSALASSQPDRTLMGWALNWAGPGASSAGAAADLSILARELSPGEAVSVLFVRSDPSEAGGLFIELDARMPTQEGYGGSCLRPSIRAIEEAIRATFPECVPVRSPALLPVCDHLLPLPVRLCRLADRPERTIVDSGDVALLTWKAETTQNIGLPVQATVVPNLSPVLEGLLALQRPFALRVTLTAFTLTTLERRIVVSAADQLCADAPLLLQDPAGFHARLRDRQILSAWAGAGCGWHISLSLDLPGTFADQLFLSRTVMSRFGESEADPASLLLDLSSALPRSGAGPNGLFPSVPELRALGFLKISSSTQPTGNSVADLLHLGTNLSGRSIAVPRADLGRHMLILGATGTGKSTLIRQMVHQDIADGIASVVIDPHGDLVHDIWDHLDAATRDRVIMADLAADPESLGLDLLDIGDTEPTIAANRIANDLSEVFQRVLYTDTPEAFGPMFQAYFRNGLALLMLGAHSLGQRPNLCDFDRVFHDGPFRKSLLSACSDPAVVRFWTGIATRAGGEAALENIAPYIVAKLTQLTGNPRLRPIVAGEGRPLDPGKAFDAGRTILVNLSKGSLGATDAALVGALALARILRDLLARCSRPRSGRAPVRVYLDEFQTYATDSLGQLMAEGRKTGAELICCSQDLTSFGGSQFRPHVVGTILSNVSQLLSFRIGPRDAALLSDWFSPTLGSSDLMGLPDRVFAARLMAHGLPLPVQIGRTVSED